jgi:Predicted permease
MKWKDKINKKYMQISMYVIFTVLIIILIWFFLRNFTTITDVVMTKVSWLFSVLRPIILGFVFAYLMDPLVNFFEDKYRRLKKVKFFRRMGSPRTWAAITAALLFFVLVVGLISLLVFTVTDQLRLANFGDVINLAQVYMKNINDFYNSVLDKMKELNLQSQELDKYVQSASTMVLDTIKSIAYGAVNSITNISGYMTTIIFSLIIGIYFMIDGRMFANFFVKVCRALFNDNANKKIFNTAHDLDEVFSGYVRGQLTDAFVMLILISTTLSIIGVKFAILIGVFAGIGNLIPYFGPIVAYVGTTIACLVNGDFKKLIIALIALFIIQALDGNFIGPKLLSNAIQIHPLIVMVSIIIGGAIGGFLGMLLAVPVGAYIKMVFVRFINRRLQHKEELEQAKIVFKK